MAGQRVLFAGRLAGMSRREAQQVVKSQGGMSVDRLDDAVDLVVKGEESLADSNSDVLVQASRLFSQRGTGEIITETELWQRLGFVEGEQDIHRLYTPAMLADLLGVEVSVVRRWQRRGLIVPVREVKRLAYFDFQEVTTARRLVELLAAGLSPQAIEKKLASLSRVLPGVARPLAQLPVLVQGKELLLRQGDGLIDPAGQWRFDFEATASPDAGEHAPASADVLSITLAASHQAGTHEPGQLIRWAADLEDMGQLAAAAEMYRAALAAGGPRAEVCFLLAELLYRLDDLPAARERYYMAVELDDQYVEARANLGCVLVELGDRELAVAAFEGALTLHGEYPDVHYHLARTLDELDRKNEAEPHWRAFLELAADSPWASEALHRLGK